MNAIRKPPLSRGPRKRLTPYGIRDAALFTSGLMNGQIGGIN